MYKQNKWIIYENRHFKMEECDAPEGLVEI